MSTVKVKRFIAYIGRGNLVFVKSPEFLSVTCMELQYGLVEITNGVLIKSSPASFSVVISQVCIYLTSCRPRLEQQQKNVFASKLFAIAKLKKKKTTIKEKWT